MKITKEQFRKLKPFERILSKVTFKSRGGFYVGYEDRNKLAELYKEITPDVNACSSCSNDWIKRLSYWYYESKEKYSKK